MNQISFIYYGNRADIQQHMLFLLGLIEVSEPREARTGLYAIERRFGKELVKKISFDANNVNADDVLIYRYLSSEELEQIKDPTRNIKFYVILHNFIDLDYIKENLFQADGRSILVVSPTALPSMRSQNSIKNHFDTKNIFYVKPVAVQNDEAQAKSSILNVPMLLLFLIKAIMNPVNEIKHYGQLLKFTNLRYISRLVELFMFLYYIIEMSFVNPVVALIKGCFYLGLAVAGFTRVVAIKSGFLIRHILLMCGFKSFGFFVDSYNLLLRLKDFLLDFLFYRFLQPVFYKLVELLYYGLGYRLYYAFVNIVYYKIGYFLYYKVGYFLYFRILQAAYYHILMRSYYYIAMPTYYLCLKAIYFIRYLVLMTGYKTYGLVFDVCTFSYRVTKLILLFPVFKIYWFSRFQYNKRIKKYFA